MQKSKNFFFLWGKKNCGGFVDFVGGKTHWRVLTAKTLEEAVDKACSKFNFDLWRTVSYSREDAAKIAVDEDGLTMFLDQVPQVVSHFLFGFVNVQNFFFFFFFV